MIQVVGRHDFLLAMCFLAKTTLPGFHTDQPICSSNCQVARKIFAHNKKLARVYKPLQVFRFTKWTEVEIQAGY
jgi:uncharacterized protein YcgI (DUF1989 family)